MGSVRFTCACGFRFLDSTDDRSYVAHFMPEQEWLPFLDAVDEAVEGAGSPREREDACFALRARRPRTAWQCPRCGELYLEDQAGSLHRFLPASEDVPRELFLPGAPPVDLPRAPEGPPAVSAASERVAACRRIGEEAYDRMYDASSASAATGHYSDAKEAFHDAIAAARELGLAGEAEALEARLAHIKAVFRSQFS